MVFTLVFISVIGIVIISQFVSRIGVYHREYSDKCVFPKWLYDYLQTDEKLTPFQINFPEMFLNYIILSIPLYVIFIFILDPTNFFANSSISNNVKNEFIATMAIIPAYLFSIRILSNPLNKNYWSAIKVFYEQNSDKRNLKRDILSFYFALTATSFFIMVFDFFYKSLGLVNDVTTYWSNLKQLFYQTLIPQFDGSSFILYICAYLIMLFMASVILELILQYCDPIENV